MGCGAAKNQQLIRKMKPGGPELIGSYNTVDGCEILHHL
jgi:hypothetical protein